MFGADVGMVEGLCFFVSKGKDLFHPRGIRNVSSCLLRWAGADFLFDLHADGFELEAHPFEDIDGHALAELDQTEQQVLGADIGVVESVRFLTSESEDLLSTWSEVVHASPGLEGSEIFFSSFDEIRLSGDSRESKRERTISARIESRSSGESLRPEWS